MWHNKKFIIIALLAAVLVAGTIGGAVYAQTPKATPPAAPGKTLFARVATILGIDQQKLENAFAQAEREMRSEALDNQLKRMVEQGTITRQQADQYKAWWLSKPAFADRPGFPGGPGPGFAGPLPKPKPGFGGRGWGKMGPPPAPPGGAPPAAQ